MKKILSRAELEKIYKDNSNKEACELLGVSTTTLTKCLKQAGIPLKGQGYGKRIDNKKIEILSE